MLIRQSPSHWGALDEPAIAREQRHRVTLAQQIPPNSTSGSFIRETGNQYRILFRYNEHIL